MKIAPKKRTEQTLSVLKLEVTRENDHIKISAKEETTEETSTIWHYEETKVSIDWIEARSYNIVETLNMANRKGRVSRDVLITLREIGQVFCDELFTLDIKEALKNTKAEYLNLSLDDKLVHVPWELLYDGQQFLCQRFNMGRLVRTRQAIHATRSRILAQPLRMLILADPGGDLKWAHQEGIQILHTVDMDKDFINASLRSVRTTPDFIRDKMRSFDLLHFAGHADYNPQFPEKSGWRLGSGSLTAQDIKKMAGTATMPALIFSNACQSARTEEWDIKEHFQDEIFGLANAFVLSGVKHYVGTFWEILDEPGSRFALEFYKALLSGMTIGKAVRESRLALIKQYGEETIVWGSYILYGDPTFRYMDHIKMIQAKECPNPQFDTLSHRGGRTKEKVDHGKNDGRNKNLTWVGLFAGIILFISLVISVVLWGNPRFLNNDTTTDGNTALAYYNEGNFEDALKTCKILENKSPDFRLAYLIQGDIYLSKGTLNAAKSAYQKALQASKGTDLEKASALTGLGRVASLQKETDVALQYYRQAIESDPGSGKGYLSLAFILSDKKNYDEALKLLEKAMKIAPDDQSIASITNEIRKKIGFARDIEKQDRIDRMVKELLESMKSSPMALPSDVWISHPLTMWIIDFESHGYAHQEGEKRLIAAGISAHIHKYSRVRLVERVLLDKLLEELKLGTSKLAEPGRAVSLGRIMAARLILSGRVIYMGPCTEISMRLIETETGEIKDTVSESFRSADPVSVMVNKLSETLLSKLKELYPIRGRVLRMEGDNVILNIGQKIRVGAGQRFKVIGDDVELEIISIQQDTSLAKIIKGEKHLENGQRVEAL